MTERRGTPKITKDQWERFIKSLRKFGNVTVACDDAGIAATKTAYRHAKSHPDFAEEWADAIRDSQDVINAEMHRRGITGYLKQVVSMGRLVFDKDGEPVMEWVASDAVLLRLHAARTDEGKAMRAPPPPPPPEDETLVAARLYRLMKAMEGTVGGTTDAKVVSSPTA